MQMLAYEVHEVLQRLGQFDLLPVGVDHAGAADRCGTSGASRSGHGCGPHRLGSAGGGLGDEGRRRRQRRLGIWWCLLLLLLLLMPLATGRGWVSEQRVEAHLLGAEDAAGWRVLGRDDGLAFRRARVFFEDGCCQRGCGVGCAQAMDWE